ncbi:hypothetical protein CQJ94_12060 [Glycomyces fuscus]|nr:hypothetical protein CQJ94_12060 [Glycomyces fuscus]
MAAMLVDRATGQAHARSGTVSVLPDPEHVTDSHQTALDLAVASREPVVQESVVTTGGHYVLTRAVPSPGADEILLVLVFDRARTNLALARYQADEHTAALLP